MNLQNYYYYFTSVLTPKFCDDVIKHAKLKKEKLGQIGNLNEKKGLKKIRNSNVVFLDDQWIYKEIHPYIHEANKSAGWNFDWDYSESCQFTKYKTNQFYNWHCDSWDSPYNNSNNLNFNGKIRKLSVTCSLSDSKDYKGGELEFDFRNNSNGKPVIKTCKEILPRGSIVVFPSFVWHRVKPVKKGTRYSLVIWNLGYPFK